MLMLTKILKIKGDWQEVLDDCRSTVGKEPLGREPSTAFKKAILIAEHSPIRDISIKWRWSDMPHWVTGHWARHKWEKFIRTQRSDRTGVPREKLPQDEPQTFVGEANSQHLIDTMRKRLCRQASTETRKYAEDLKKSVEKVQPELADVLVPNCVYRCGCPELDQCSFWADYEKYCFMNEDLFPGFMTIQQRYDAYNRYFKMITEESEEAST